MNKAQIAAHFDRYASERDKWKQRNRYYYQELERLCQEHIPPGKTVLELGCGTGDLLAGVEPTFGVGLDLSTGMVKQARCKYPTLRFLQGDAEAIPLGERFDFVILSDLIGHLHDIQTTLEHIRRICKPKARIIITYYNFVWQPILTLGERIGMKMPQQQQNWLGMADVENLLYLCDYQLVEQGVRLLVPKQVPLLAEWLNTRLIDHSLARWIALIQYFVARPLPETPIRDKLTCSVIIPCRNEAGNIVGAVERTPQMGAHTELIFVDGDSGDGTVGEIERQIARWEGIKDIRLIHQVPRSDASMTATSTPDDLMLSLGKGDAVRKGFAAAKGEVLMILDADLTVPPEDLPKFFKAIAQGKGRIINGTRLVYPLEDEAMKFLNMVGNKIFSWVFTWLLGQYIKDTLCGTKVLFKSDYEQIAAGRSYFGDFDPFGDFDLLFGAARLSLPITEVPVRYCRRTYGDSKVRVFKHGVLLGRMSWVGFRKLKLGRLYEDGLLGKIFRAFRCTDTTKIDQDQVQVLDRKAREIQQGVTIADHALDVWGWTTPAGRERAKRRAELLIDHGAISSSMIILELGCGTGLFSRHLGQTGAQVIALDLSWDLLVQARQENGQANAQNVVLVLADAENLPFAPSAFDAVVGSSILHHLQPENALAEAYRVLQPGGNIAFAEPNMLNPQIALQKNVPAIKRRLGDTPDETAFFRWQATGLLKRAGFTNIGSSPYDFLHPHTPESLIAPIQKLGQCLESIPVLREVAGSLVMWGRKPVLLEKRIGHVEKFFVFAVSGGYNENK